MPGWETETAAPEIIVIVRDYSGVDDDDAAWCSIAQRVCTVDELFSEFNHVEGTHTERGRRIADLASQRVVDGVRRKLALAASIEPDSLV